MDTVLRNIRYAARTLCRSPGLSLVVVSTLALGIGASSAVFTTVNAVLLEPLPFPEADRLVSVRQTREGAAVANVAPVRLEEWNALNETFEALTGFTTEDISDPSPEIPERIRLASVSPRMIDVWRVQPILGRGFIEADHVEGAAPVAMISEDYWRRRFDASPRVIGTPFGPLGRQAEIIGVMPASFAFPDAGVELWVANVFADFLLRRGNAWYTAFGRLKPGVSAEQAQADLRRVQAQLAAQYPDTDRSLSADVVPLHDVTVGSLRASLWLVFGAVSVLLLIACTNIAALLLSRAAERQQEVSIRRALGSSSARIASQVLTETSVLAVVGALLGLLVASAITLGFRALAPSFPRLDEIEVSAGTLVFVAALIVTVTLACGLAPALRNTRSAHGGAIVDTGRTQVSKRHSVQWLFVGVQITLSVVLLAAAGLLIRSFQELSRVDPGFDPSNVLTFRITGSYAEEAASTVRGVERMIEELQGLPGVEAAATSSPVPGVASDRSGFQFGAFAYEPVDGGIDPEIDMITEYRVVSPSYFETMQIPLLAGNPCPRRVPGAGTPEVMINQAFATRYLSGIDPIGRHLRAGDNVVRIAGVVGSAREFGLARVPVPTTYGCFTVVAYPPLAFLVRTRGDPLELVGTVRARLAEIEPSRSVYDVMTLDQRIGNEYTAERLQTATIGLFAGAALLLVALGIYGTLSYIVSLRKREVGLRVALGALQHQIVSHYLAKALRVVAIASAIGFALYFAISRSLASMLFGVSPSDPITLVGVVAAVLAVATAAALLPALRASRIDPMRALREE